MEKYLYVISPTTNEIFSFLYDRDVTFRRVINYLRELGKPSELISYDGDIFIIEPYYLISGFVHLNRYSVILAYYETDVELPKIEIPPDNHMIIFYDPSENQLVPYIARLNETVSDIIDNLFLKYDKVFSITLAGYGELINETVFELFLFRDTQKLLILKDISNVTTILDKIPLELTYDILSKLDDPRDIEKTCRSSRLAINYCKDRSFWTRLLRTNFNVRDIPLQQSAKELYYKYFNMEPNQLLIEGIKNHNRIIVEKALKRGAFNYRQAMREAATSGNIEIVQLMLNKGADNFDETMAAAALQGHLNIVKLMLNPYNLPDEVLTEGGTRATNYRPSFRNAAQGGHLQIINFFLPFVENNPRIIDDGMVFAAYGGHLDIVKLMRGKGSTMFDLALRLAAGKLEGKSENTVLEIVKFFLKLGPNIYTPTSATYYITSIFAAEAGYRKIIDVILSEINRSNFLPNYTSIMYGAASGGHLDIIKSLENYVHHPDYSGIILYAAKGRNKDIVEYVLPKIEISSNIMNKVMLRTIEGNIGWIDTTLKQIYDEDIKLPGNVRNWEPDYTEVVLKELDEKYGQILIENIYDIVNLTLQEGINMNYNLGLKEASFRGYLKIIQLMINPPQKSSVIFKGANNFRTAIFEATTGGHFNIVKLMATREIDFVTYFTSLEEAVLRGYNKIAKFLLEKLGQLTLDDYSKILNAAARSGNIEILELILTEVEEYYRNNFEQRILPKYNKILIDAATWGQKDIVDLMLAKGADAYHLSLDKAEKNNHWLIANILNLKIS